MGGMVKRKARASPENGEGRGMPKYGILGSPPTPRKQSERGRHGCIPVHDGTRDYTHGYLGGNIDHVTGGGTVRVVLGEHRSMGERRWAGR